MWFGADIGFKPTIVNNKVRKFAQIMGIENNYYDHTNKFEWFGVLKIGYM